MEVRQIRGAGHPFPHDIRIRSLGAHQPDCEEDATSLGYHADQHLRANGKRRKMPPMLIGLCHTSRRIPPEDFTRRRPRGIKTLGKSLEIFLGHQVVFHRMFHISPHAGVIPEIQEEMGTAQSRNVAELVAISALPMTNDQSMKPNVAVRRVCFTVWLVLSACLFAWG